MLNRADTKGVCKIAKLGTYQSSSACKSSETDQLCIEIQNKHPLLTKVCVIEKGLDAWNAYDILEIRGRRWRDVDMAGAQIYSYFTSLASGKRTAQQLSSSEDGSENMFGDFANQPLANAAAAGQSTTSCSTDARDLEPFDVRLASGKRSAQQLASTEESLENAFGGSVIKRARETPAPPAASAAPAAKHPPSPPAFPPLPPSLVATPAPLGMGLPMAAQAAAPVPAAAEAVPEEGNRFQPGNRVQLNIPLRNAHWNGQKGTVLPAEAGTTTALVPGTVKVLLDLGPEVAVKPQNIVGLRPLGPKHAAVVAAPA